MEHNVDIPGGGLQGLRPVQGSTASRTFSPPNKSAKVTGHSSARVPRSVSSSELSAHLMARAARPQDFSDDGNIFREHEEKIWIRLDTGQWKLLCTDTVVDQPWSQWKCLRFSSSAMAWWGIAGLGAWFGSGYMVCVSSLGAFGWFSIVSTHLEIGHYVHEPLVSGSSCSLFGCTLHGAMLGSTVDTCYASAPGAFGRFSS